MKEKTTAIITAMLFIGLIIIPPTGLYMFFEGDSRFHFIPDSEKTIETNIEYEESGNKNAVEESWDVYILSDDDITDDEKKLIQEKVKTDDENNTINFSQIDTINKDDFNSDDTIAFDLSNERNIHSFSVNKKETSFTFIGEIYFVVGFLTMLLCMLLSIVSVVLVLELLSKNFKRLLSLILD